MIRVAALLAVAFVVVACSTSIPSGAPVAVRITDSSFELDVSSVVGGPVAFTIENSGSMVHEFEVFAGAEPGRVLEVVNGVADTTGLSVVDEFEDIIPGQTVMLRVDLERGTYLLLCNLPGHYQAGNWEEFTVTG
jgi:uncharacterized cupredoxin-like copper-binding protein